MYEGALYPGEPSIVDGAILARCREFRAGRAAARCALVKAEGPAVSILADTNRVPIWPTGFVGSISHCDVICAAVVAQCTDTLGLGLDLESARVIPEDLLFSVLDADEQMLLRERTTLDPIFHGILGFSAKEAFYKAIYPLERTFLDFSDVRLELSSATNCCGAFHISSDEQHPDWDGSGRWRIHAGIVYTAYEVSKPRRYPPSRPVLDIP